MRMSKHTKKKMHKKKMMQEAVEVGVVGER
jgi:hypothetical protein